MSRAEKAQASFNIYGQAERHRIDSTASGGGVIASPGRNAAHGGIASVPAASLCLRLRDEFTRALCRLHFLYHLPDASSGDCFAVEEIIGVSIFKMSYMIS